MPHHQQQSSKHFGAADYRAGALDRMVEAGQLLRTGYFAGSIYLAGRAVEGMLRAILWQKDADVRTGRKAMAAGHDLMSLLEHVGRLGLLNNGKHDENFRTRIQTVGRLWFNNMRFASSRKVHAIWRKIGKVDRHCSFKQASSEYYEECLIIVKRCEALL